MSVPTLSYAQARRLKDVRFVDLRSPAEFAVDAVPGAGNTPLFGDAERAVVGTLYKQVSVSAALDCGLGLAEARLPVLLEEILGRKVDQEDWRNRFLALAGLLKGGAESISTVEPAEPASLGPRPLVLYCWRGGMRSRSVGALLRGLGESGVVHLSGGYKGYRAWVRERLAGFDPVTPLILLRGPTGVGKTCILHRLEAALPGSTIDLEGLARHRSSILGDIGLEPASARTFESGLAARLEAMGPPPWFVEGESRKVGDVVVPEPFFRAMETGTQVRIDASMEHRVAVLKSDYLSRPGAADQLGERLPFLEKRMGPSWVGRLRKWLAAGESGRVAETLLESYYDVRYARSDRRRVWEAHLDAEDPGLIARLLALRAGFLERASARAGC